MVIINGGATADRGITLSFPDLAAMKDHETVSNPPTAFVFRTLTVGTCFPATTGLEQHVSSVTSLSLSVNV